MFSVPFAGAILGAASVHPVHRGGADVEAFRLAQRILQAGNVLLVFPEGTRSPTGGLQRPREGIGLLAQRSRAPILPVGVTGSDGVWPRGDRPHLGGRIVIRVGRPFTLEAVLGDEIGDRRQVKRLATDAIMERIAALLPQGQRGVYGAGGDDAVVTAVDTDQADEGALAKGKLPGV